MRRLRLLGVLACMGYFSVACEPVPHYNRVQVAAYGGKFARKPYGTVKVVQTADDIKRPYEIIGNMSCEGSAGDEAGILNAMLYRAADMGADRLLLNVPRIGSEDLGATQSRVDVRIGWGALIGNGDNRAYRAQAIRFKE